MADPDIRQMKDVLMRIASEVSMISEGWPTLLRTLGDLSKRQDEHERRIIKLESHALEETNNYGHKPLTPEMFEAMRKRHRQESEWDLGEVSPTGSHRVLTLSEFERLKLKDKAARLDWLSQNVGKIISHVIVFVTTGAIAATVHYLSK